MAKNTYIGPHDHSPCVEPAPPKRIRPEDIPSEEIVPTNPPKKKKIQDEAGHIEDLDQKVSYDKKSDDDTFRITLSQGA